ncbi:MAG TPA: FKBP-type peptidyl-prolyl cis-trans isomerase [Iamia sp.]|nr:FKBP-type peptidyl-prolyl cis-trans isomerase [Iamia sp.]
MYAQPCPRAPRRLIACGALALTLVLGASACGSDDDGNVVADVYEDDALPTQPSAPESTTTLPQTCEPTEPTEVTAEDKPVIEVPEGDAPDDLVIETLREGEGREAADGDSVQVQYTGALLSDGTEFDTSWDDLTPLPVTVGAGGVIDGFDEGLVGMKLGERRMLTIPSDQAYGEAGSGEAIPPDSDLIFVIDLVQVCFPDPDAAPAEGEGEGDGSTTTVAEGEEGSTTTAAEGEETTTTVAEGGEETTTTVAEGDAEGETTTTAAEG